MTGEQYEQFVKAALVQRLHISPGDLKSTKEHGVTFPGDKELVHQIDLYHVDSNEVAEYVTIIECKHRSSGKVDQEEVAKFAYVKGSVKASKAIMVTNISFTSGAIALAKAEKIALLVITPDSFVEEQEYSGKSDDVFEEMQKLIRSRRSSYDMVVVEKLRGNPNDIGGGLDLIEGLLSDPEIGRMASDFVRENPDLAKKALDFLRKNRW